MSVIPGAVPHDVRQMVSAWHGRNMPLVDDHELLTLRKRLEGYARHLPNSYGSQRLHRKLHTELQRRGYSLTSSESAQ